VAPADPMSFPGKRESGGFCEVRDTTLAVAWKRTSLKPDWPKARGGLRWRRYRLFVRGWWAFGSPSEQGASTARDIWRNRMNAKLDFRWDRRGRAHEVSHQNGVVSDRGHSPARGTSATILVAPPHSGQVGGSMRRSSGGSVAGGSCFSSAGGSTGFVRSERKRASLDACWRGIRTDEGDGSGRAGPGARSAG
jgi:hypothetical protein